VERQAIDGLEGIFDGKKDSAKRDVDGEIKDLHAKIGALIIINDFLERGFKK
jgi:hypothetical protein